MNSNNTVSYPLSVRLQEKYPQMIDKSEKLWVFKCLNEHFQLGDTPEVVYRKSMNPYNKILASAPSLGELVRWFKGKYREPMVSILINKNGTFACVVFQQGSTDSNEHSLVVYDESDVDEFGTPEDAVAQAILEGGM